MSIRPLSKELQAIAETELNENPSRIQSDLNELNAWLDKTPHIKARRDDQFLISFLRGCKFSLEKTKAKLDAYYTNRKNLPEVFGNYKITPEIIKTLEAGVWVPFPQTFGSTGPRLILYLPSYDTETIDFYNTGKVMYFINDILQLEDDHAVVSGIGIVGDLQNTTLGHWTKFTPPYMQRYMKVLQEGNPNRVKLISPINMPIFLLGLWNIFKGFFSKKLQSRVKVFANKEEAFQSVPQKLFPKEYGGEAGTIDEILDVWVKKFQHYKKYFEEEENYGINEELRPKNNESTGLFGAEGSFRKLEIF